MARVRSDRNALAMLVIDKFRADADDDDQANLARRDEAGEAELLLALLWASERNLLIPVILEDPDESPVLNKIHHNMKARLLDQTEGSPKAPDRGQGIGFMDDDDDGIPIETHFDGDESTTSSARNPEAMRTQDRFKELTMTTAGIVEIMKQVEAARQDERKSDAQEKSLLKHLGRSQRALFLALSTPELYIDPELSEFMVQLSKEKTAARALQLIQSEAREWEGSFSAGGFHRFLSTGFLSQEVNRGNPGGYTLFMFHTRTTDLGGPQFDAGKARLRDLFEAKVDEETILHYSKQGLFAASNHHDMRVQLQTALDMLELLLGASSIATKGLAYVLEPQRWRRMSVIFHDRFKSEPQFGAKFVYCLDRSLQQFFTQVERRTEEEVRPNYLRDKAADLISMIDGGYEVTVRLPSALVPPSSSAPLALPTSTGRGTGQEERTKRGDSRTRRRTRKHGRPEHVSPPGVAPSRRKTLRRVFPGPGPEHKKLADGARRPPGDTVPRPSLHPVPSHGSVPPQLSPGARGQNSPRRNLAGDRRRPLRRSVCGRTDIDGPRRYLKRGVTARTRLPDTQPRKPTTIPTHLPFNGQQTRKDLRITRTKTPRTSSSGTRPGPIRSRDEGGGRRRPRTKRPTREVRRIEMGSRGTQPESQHPGYPSEERPNRRPRRTATEASEAPGVHQPPYGH